MNTIRVRDGLAVFMCPACRWTHEVNILGEKRPHWLWNGSMEKPTFRPSIFLKTVKITAENREAYDALDMAGLMKAIEDPQFKYWCHSFVTDGVIAFQGDSTHAYAGKSLPIAEWPGLP